MKYRYLYQWIIGITILISQVSISNANIIYVDANAGAGGNGISWVMAYKSLQDGLTVASSGDTIVVAAGVYTPHASDRSASFVLKNEVVILGSFAGTEVPINVASIDGRDFEANSSILSGDLNGDDIGFSNNSENSYHVVFSECISSSVGTATELDGFIITGGNADYYILNEYDDLRGGGIFLEANAPWECSPTFRNILVQFNSAQFGGGISIVSLNNGALCNPTFDTFVVRNNRSIEADDTQVSNGGGLMINTIDGISNPVFNEGAILDNEVVEVSTPGTGGGAVISASIFASDAECSPQFTRVGFCSNLASGGGSQINHQAQGSGAVVAPSYTNITVTGYVNSYPFYNSSIGGALAVCIPNFINTLVHTNYLTSVFNNPAPSLNGPNPVYSYCNLRGVYLFGSWSSGYGTDGGNNIDDIPVFRDSSICDVRLYDDSPEIGAGNGTNGPNIGYYQGPGLIFLRIEDASDFSDCQGDTIYTFKYQVEDEPQDSASYVVSVGHGILSVGNINHEFSDDTLRLDISIADTLTGSDTISVYLTNKMGEADSINFIISLDKRPSLNKFEHGYFNFADSTYGIALYPDTAASNPVYSIDGMITGNNYFDGLKSGYHYGLIENNGCYSDTLDIDLPVYVNDIPLEIIYFDDTTRFDLCEGRDTTLRLEFKFKDDDLDQVEWLFNYHYLKVIPDSNITLSETDSSRYFEVIIPDTFGYYNLHVHAENIYGELANIYYEIYIGNKPQIDTVFVEVYQGNPIEICIIPEVSGVENNFWLDLYLDGVQIESETYTCSVPVGEHILGAFYEGCESEPYSFAVDPTLGTSEENDILTKYRIFPIPASDHIFLKGFENPVDVMIFDLSGELKFAKRYHDSSEELDIGLLPKGMYLIQVFDGKNTIQKKLILN